MAKGQECELIAYRLTFNMCGRALALRKAHKTLRSLPIQVRPRPDTDTHTHVGSSPVPWGKLPLLIRYHSGHGPLQQQPSTPCRTSQHQQIGPRLAHRVCKRFLNLSYAFQLSSSTRPAMERAPILPIRRQTFSQPRSRSTQPKFAPGKQPHA